jgi:hypothetical protein
VKLLDKQENKERGGKEVVEMDKEGNKIVKFWSCEIVKIVKKVK